MEKPDYRSNNKQLQQKINYRVIGKHMKDLRLACNMTQSNVAEKMGVGSKYYTSLETGFSKISLARFIQFLCITQGSADTILAGSHPNLPIQGMQNMADEQNRQKFENLLNQSSMDLREVMYAVCETLLHALK